MAPGFINMLSWANQSLIEDGRSQSDIRQGVTLEVMGEGRSMGPLNDSMKAEMVRRQELSDQEQHRVALFKRQASRPQIAVYERRPPPSPLPPGAEKR